MYADIRVIQEMPGLPYSAAYSEWRAHLEGTADDGCRQCQTAVAAKSNAMSFVLGIPPLCGAGADIDRRMTEAVGFQRDTAELN